MSQKFFPSILKRGWTLIEMMFVAIMLSMLSMFAFSSYRKNFAVNQVVLGISELSGATQEVMMVLKTNTCLISDRATPQFRHIDQIVTRELPAGTIQFGSYRTCQLTGTFKSDLGEPLGGKTIDLLIYNSGGSFYHVYCRSLTIPETYLPNSCTH